MEQPAFDRIELWLRRGGGFAGLATLAAAVSQMLRSVRRPPGRQSGAGARFLRAPILALATLLFGGVMAWLWRPIRFCLSFPASAACLVLGLLVYLPALGLYLWGLRTLAGNFGPSTGFGVRLQAGHQLITTGPYALVRHPMYVAVIAAGAGGFLLYRTWSMLLFALSMFGLIFRARREEKVLAEEFGAAWEAYRQRVPAWFPHGLGKGAILPAQPPVATPTFPQAPTR